MAASSPAASRAATAAMSRPPPTASVCVAAAAAAWQTTASRTRLVLAQEYQAAYSSNVILASAMPVHLLSELAASPGPVIFSPGEDSRLVDVVLSAACGCCSPGPGSPAWPAVTAAPSRCR